jgi:hypothetical protein
MHKKRKKGVDFMQGRGGIPHLSVSIFLATFALETHMQKSVETQKGVKSEKLSWEHAFATTLWLPCDLSPIGVEGPEFVPTLSTSGPGMCSMCAGKPLSHKGKTRCTRIPLRVVGSDER